MRLKSYIYCIRACVHLKAQKKKFACKTPPGLSLPLTPIINKRVYTATPLLSSQPLNSNFTLYQQTTLQELHATCTCIYGRGFVSPFYVAVKSPPSIFLFFFFFGTEKKFGIYWSIWYQDFLQNYIFHRQLRCSTIHSGF